ncbi:MAG: Nucleoside ABC transporter, permease protein 1 [Firmicutes bacterium]|nr:Nucleoside ABC transporter, permease protein 1 [Bacillota bacterium]
MKTRIVLEKVCVPKRRQLAYRILAVVLALVLGAAFLGVMGFSPMAIYRKMFGGAFGSKYGITETIVKTIPLMLAALGVSVAFRMKLWNIGAEGQLYMGCFAASWVALRFPGLPAYVMLPAMFMAGMLGGGLWALVPAVPRALFGTNETLSTLMLNYVAILWVDYLVFGPWKDPKGFNFPITPEFSEAAFLPAFGNSRVHIGLVFGVLIAAVLYIVLKYTKWGYEIRVIGESREAAEYAGMKVIKNILLVMFLSGALAGLAGMAEVSGITHRLQSGISPGYGYSAIIIAWLSRLNPWGIIVVAFLFAGLLVGGYSVQTIGLSASIATMLQGMILFFVLASEFFTEYRIKLVRREGVKNGE